MPSKKANPSQRWSTYPALHKNVACLLAQNDLHISFRKDDDERSSIYHYDTNIMGRFSCHNSSCNTKAWSSKKIAITIRMYPKQFYNARVYHQRCRECNSLSRPYLDDSYAERVAYRLKKWSGLHMEPSYYSSERNGPPHQSRLCEGCKNGHCREGDTLYPWE